MSQLSKSSFDTSYVSTSGNFLTNGIRSITAAIMRAFTGDIKDSVLFYVDDYTYYIQGATASGTDTYTITPTIPAAYTDGERFLVTFTNANTGAATLNRNSLGAKSLVTQDGSAVASGQIVAGGTYLVRYNGTNYVILNALSEPSNSIDVYTEFKEDYFHNWTQGDFTWTNSSWNDGGGSGATPGTSTSFGVDSTEHAIGVIDLSTSTSTAGGSVIVNSSVCFITFGFGFQFDLSHRIALDALSDGTDTYLARFGFMDGYSDASPVVDGVFFRYTHGVNSGKWEAVTLSNSTETAEDTGITAEAGVFHVFRIVVNSDATQVDFYVDGVKTNDITTNIINSTSRLTAMAVNIKKTAGSTARHLYVDWSSFLLTRTTAR